MGKKKEVNDDMPRVHEDLKGFNIKINTFGEIQMTYDVEKINNFLNKNVEDKKLKESDEDE